MRIFPLSLMSNRATAALLLTLLMNSPLAVAAQSSEPMLRIETGMHTAFIRRIGVDAANRFLVTASVDKTLRLWELPSGRLLRTIRVPIGAGNEGQLYAAALSPDGRTIAVGGYTLLDGKSTSIYLFERESGRLIQRLTGLPEVVPHLAYSPDGRFLAATLDGKNGVRVYRTKDYALAGEDKDYGDRSDGTDFDRTGRLVTASFDGYIRLYAPVGKGGLRLLAKRQVASGDQPHFVSFSPDGARIAVGFYGSTRVAVLSGRDLSPLYTPGTPAVSVSKGSSSSVAWSADGNTLYAGGWYSDTTGHRLIRAWADGGRGRDRDLVLDVTNTIMHILRLRDGGIVYGAGDPAFGTLDAGGRRTLFVGATIADYRNLGLTFRLSPDGSGVEFAYQQFGKSPARFSLTERRLDVGSAPARDFRPPITEAPGLSITDWEHNYEPKLNGRRLPLEQHEMSHSLAIAPDASAFLLGADLSLRCFDRSGKQRWGGPAPAPVWAVNISADGRLGVAALGNGSINWFRITDGKWLLGLFPHADRKRWIVRTFSGYYDASPGAEDLIGWHVNRGRDAAADFFPVGKFRSTFYRPDVVAKMLLAGDEQVALWQANEEAGRKQEQANVAQRLPPVVEILSPSDGAAVSSVNMVIRYSVRTPSGGPVTEVKVLVDGRPVSVEREPKESVSVTVPTQDSEVSVIAKNRFAASVPATVRLKWRGRAAAPAEEFVIKPRLYVLAVGVSDYSNPDLKLDFAAKDARDFAGSLEPQKGGLYREVAVKLLTDAKATRDAIVDGLDWITKETTSKDVAMVFFAGHGVNDPTGNYYFLPANVDLDHLKRSGVAFSDIKSTVETLAGKTLFFVDTCHSGNVLGKRRGLPLDITGIVNELSSAENGAVVFAASTGNQYSMENPTWGNGAFTKALVEGLRGRADYAGRGKITVNMLDLYISEKVKELTKGQQTPTTTKPETVPDFPIALKR